MTSDCYAILGVSPTAEDVVIGAAYRALMRHYHPDTNADPRAQARAQEITAAYAILRNPVSRAEYDAGRKAANDFWEADDPPRRPPPLRSAAIASAALAALLVGAVWASQGDRPANASVAAAPPKSSSTKVDQNPAEPPRELEPEERRLERLAPPVAPPPVDVEAGVALAPVMDPVPPVPRERPPAIAVKPRVPLADLPKPPPRTAAQPMKPAPAAPQSDRLATLDRMSSGFFSQSMTHADNGKKTLLLSARDRSETERKACRTESCVADAYLRQIRATSAIMEGKTGPK